MSAASTQEGGVATTPVGGVPKAGDDALLESSLGPASPGGDPDRRGRLVVAVAAPPG